MSSASTPKTGAGDVIWENIQTVLIALVLAMGIRFVGIQPFRIPSGSMQPTLLVGDYILVAKWSYGYSRFSFTPFNFGAPKGRLFGGQPKRGDIVVFRPTMQEDKDLVKRLIGLPGDTVQVLDGALYINGKGVPRTPLGPIAFKDENGGVQQIPEYQETLPNGVSYVTFDRNPRSVFDNTGIYHVPEGFYFFMGDDRDNSDDSRSLADVGYVPYDHLVGHVLSVAVSFDPTETSLFLPWTWFTGARGDRLFKAIK